MKRNGTADQAKRFVELKQQIVVATGLPSDAPRVSYLATLTLQAERLQSRVIAGDNTVTGAELLALRTTIEEISPVAPHTVRIEYVDGTRKTCPFCHTTFNPHDDRSKALPPEPPPPTPPPRRRTTLSN
jgi:hypothetical protein